MKLIFADKTELEIISIFGGSKFVQGFNRDVLDIHVDPAVASIDKLLELFKDENKTKTLQTQERKMVNVTNKVQKPSTTNPEEMVEVDEVTQEEQDVTTELGEWYTLYLGARNEFKEVVEDNAVGSAPKPPAFKEVNIVSIGQLTYLEMTLAKMGIKLTDMPK